MSRNVRGALFADYVRMIRGNKSVAWDLQLSAEDLPYLESKIDPKAWYPMATFERMGNAILREVAHRDLEAVRMWGRFSVEQLRAAMPTLVAERDPMETLMRFRVFRSTFFDFDALEVPTIAPDHTRLVIRYHMGPMAEEAAAYQTMGFFERLLEIAGATNVHARFNERAWTGERQTLLEIHWILD